MTHLKISVDGSFTSYDNPVYGAIVVQNQETKQILSYRIKCDTEELKVSRNVYGEVAAASVALFIIEEALKADPDVKVTLIYDYEGVKKWANGEWGRNPKKPPKPIAKLYMELLDEKAHLLPHIEYVWQKSHSGITGENSYLNHLADQIAGLVVKPVFEIDSLF